ncbi:tetratricopeptide repeat protein [Limisphaera ngatamarikiensis]|uniref:Tetratricopeptide repeat protein n=1 Tax=Limisphaera ngatamarikiensis TaxID=1324935 RepID=A0A6M1RWT8_9BACT|nr:tetratricopeptide repeat protein [Limisphaera ngatamarikiensis]NGO39232.1 tetratricopeptide repeat protein [Limisphaera ngatamarikiensis]
MQRTVCGWAAAAVCAALMVLTGCSREARVQRHLNRAERLYQAGDYDRAEIEYRNALKYGGTNRTAVVRLGLILHQEGRLLEAHSVLRMAAELDPDNADVRVAFGQCLLALGNVGGARTQALAVLTRAPANTEAWLLLWDATLSTNHLAETRQWLEKLAGSADRCAGYHLVWSGVHAREGDRARAEAAVQRALEVEPNSPAAHFARGTWLARADKIREAEEEFKKAAELGPLRSPYRLRYAEFKAATGDRTGARAILEELVKKAPDFLPAWTELAKLELAERNWDAADQALRRVLVRDPVNLPALLLRPQLAVAQGRYTNAVAELEKILKLIPNHPRVLYQMALASLMVNDVSRAITSLEQSLEAAPDNAEAVVLLAELRLRRGDPGGAIQLLEPFAARHPEAWQARLLLARAYLARNEVDRVLNVYRALARDFPTNPTPWLLTGLIQRERGQLDTARQAFENAVRIRPGYLPAVEQLVQLDLIARRFDDARRRAEAELARHTNSPLPWMLLYQVHLFQTNLPEAERALLKAVEVAPDYRPAHAELARIYVATGRQNEAVDRLQGLVKANPKDIVSLMQLALLHTALTNYAEARKTYERILEIQPRYGPALNNLAWLLAENLNDLDRAYQLARQAVDLQPGEPASADTLGWILFRRGEYARALPLLQESARKLPEEPEVQFHLAMTHYMLGEETAARVAFQTTIQLRPDGPEAQEARRRLALLDLQAQSVDDARLAELEARARKDPRDPVLWSRIAEVYAIRGRWAQAVEAGQKALELVPDSVVFMTKVARWMGEMPDRLDRAIELARRARDRAPDDAQAAYTLARLVWRKGDQTWAASLLEEVARKLPNDPRVWYDLAWARYSQGRVAQAQQALQQAAQLRPDPSLTRQIEEFQRAIALAENPPTTPAEASQLRQWAVSRTNDVPALVAWAALEARSGNAAEAARLYEAARAVFPNFTPALRELAILYAGPLKQPDKAYELALRIRENDRNDAAIARIVGVLGLQRGDLARASAALTDYTRQRPDDAEAFYQLGLVQRQLKQPGQARQSLERALALAPNAPFAAEARKVLAELK